MTTRQQGIAAIKAHEGLRLQAYPDPASGGEPWTIGWGRAHGVKRGDIITIEQAEQFLAEDIETAQDGIRNLVKVPLTDGQLWALTSFVFNLGAGALRKSTLLKRLNAGDYAGAANEFGRWINAAGKPMPGLVRRRAEEKAMFLSAGPVNTSPAPAPKPESVKEAPVALPAILAALLPSLIENIPKLGKLFGSGSEVAERNVAAATVAMNIVKEAVGATNEQEAIERIKTDPEALQAATKAIEARWLDLSFDGVDSARKTEVDNATAGYRFWFSPSFWVTVLLLPLVYIIVGSLVGLWGTATWSDEVRASIATAIISLVIGGAVGYFWGATTSRNRIPGQLP